MPLLAKDILDELLHARNAGHSANKNYLVNLLGVHTRVPERFLHRRHASLYKILDELFKLRSSKVHIEMLRTLRGRRNKRKVDLRLHQLRQLHLGLLGSFPQSLKRHGILSEVNSFLLLELVGDVVQDALVKIITTEVCIAVCRFYLKDSFAQFKNRDIECPPSKIEHRDFDVLMFLVETVRQCGRCGLVDNSPNV